MRRWRNVPPTWTNDPVRDEMAYQSYLEDCHDEENYDDDMAYQSYLEECRDYEEDER